MAVDPTYPQQRLQDFAHFLKANGIRVDTGALIHAGESLRVTGLATRAQVMTGLRSCLTSNQREFVAFSGLFNQFFQAHGEDALARGTSEPEHNAQTVTSVSGQRLLGLAGTSEKQRQQEEVFGAGDFKALSLADFRFVFNATEMLAIERMVEEIARRARRQATRQWRAGSTGSVLDIRRTLRQSFAYEGQLVDPRWRRVTRRPERFVLLLDISQSMDVYARLFLRFMRVLMRVFTESYAFVFNTELEQLGRGHAKLREQDFEVVMNATGKGWLGGTRIAAAFEAFEAEYAVSLLNHRTTLLVFSDGCDTAKPERLAEATRRLRQRPRRVLWVNPLLGRFEAGQANRYMDPVVPHVDRYLPAHNLQSLVALSHELIG